MSRLRTRLRVLAALGAAVVLALAAGCGDDGADGSGAGDRLRVVATYSIAADMAQRVGGDRIALTTLVGPDGDAHVYEPTPDDAARVAEADVLIENGLGFEVWLGDLYAASGSDARRVVLAEGITPRRAGHSGGDDHGGGPDAGAPEAEEELDPHIWHDVVNAQAMVRNIRDGLIAADPGSADAYRAGADAYLAELEELDAEVREAVGGLPEARRTLVTTHDTFGYFADRYGFRVVGTALPTSTEAADPGAGELAELVETIRAADVPAIFGENITNDDVLEQVAREAGVAVGPELYTDALGPAGSPGETYAGMVRSNVTAMVDALAAGT